MCDRAFLALTRVRGGDHQTVKPGRRARVRETRERRSNTAHALKGLAARIAAREMPPKGARCQRPLGGGLQHRC
jgi:hypothetical protein